MTNTDQALTDIIVRYGALSHAESASYQTPQKWFTGIPKKKKKQEKKKKAVSFLTQSFLSIASAIVQNKKI